MSENFLKNTNTDLKTAILNTIAFEVQNANNFVTRHTINLRVLKQVADILNLPWNYCTESKSIYIHPENLRRIDDKWKCCLQGNFQASHDEINAYEKIKSADYVKLFDVIKFINILVRKELTERDPQNKEKILRTNDLNILFAIDGFRGTHPADVKNYVDNLKYSNDKKNHLNVIRQIYNLDLLKNLSGTDSSCIIFLSLLIVYKKFMIKDEDILEDLISNVKKYLMKNAQFYGDIQTALDKIDDISMFYQDNMNFEELKEIAQNKISNVLNKFKKRKNMVVEKEGRKRKYF